MLAMKAEGLRVKAEGCAMLKGVSGGFDDATVVNVGGE